jgi:Ca-activated chloride channel family protein
MRPAKQEHSGVPTAAPKAEVAMRRSSQAGIVVLVALGCYLLLFVAPTAVAEQPLLKDDVTALLRGGTSSESIIALVEQRGVNFRMDPDIAKELYDAGASDELIEALQKAGGSVMSAPPGVAATAPETIQTAPSAPPAAMPPAATTPMPAGPVAATADAVLVPAGTALGLELQDSLNTKYTQKGDAASFKVSPEVEIGGRVVIPRDSAVEATVIRAKRGGLALRKGELRLKFDKIVLPDGTTLPLAAKVTRVGRWNRSDKITAVASSDRDTAQDLISMAEWALIGAGVGAAIGADAGNVGKGAAIGAGAVVAIGVLEMLKRRGPDLDLPPGTMFQIELTEPLKVPVASGGGTQLVTSSLPPQPPPPLPTGVPAAGGAPPTASAPEPTPETRAPPKAEFPPPPTATVAASSTTTPPPVPLPPPADTTLVESDSGFMIKVDVNLVMVEATVRDERGAIYIKLKQEDFLVLEDGVKQEVRHFSRDELPLAVALVIDRTGSVAPFMDRLRRAAYETLSQLKAGDQVALFAFAERPERLEDLTTEREVIANSIATIQASGATNINDALYEAAAYLGREAPERRHAIILISDNQHNFNGFADERAVIRTALETESVVYSIKVQDRSPLSVLAQPIPMRGSGVVKTITRETGGEIFDIKEMGSVESAMQAVVSRLKLRFTLGYQSTNKRRDGAFRKIEVRVTKKEASGFTVYARRGYYAPRPGREEFLPPSPDTYPAVAGRLPSVGRPASATEQRKVPSKPFTNEDVLKLVKAGFGEETILEAIRTNECHFDTSADALTALKNAGVSEKIIMAMLAAGRAPAR